MPDEKRWIVSYIDDNGNTVTEHVGTLFVEEGLENLRKVIERFKKIMSQDDILEVAEVVWSWSLEDGFDDDLPSFLKDRKE